MTEAAVTRHLERRAAQLLTYSAFTTLAQAMTTVIRDRPFLIRRLRE
ncbi:hypothetical protein [Spirillospora sp. NPDC047279]